MSKSSKTTSAEGREDESLSELHYAKLCEQAEKRLASVQGMVQTLAPHWSEKFATILSTIAIPHFRYGSNGYVAPFAMNEHLAIIDEQLTTVERMLRPLVNIANTSVERIETNIADTREKLAVELERISTPGIKIRVRDAAQQKIGGYERQMSESSNRLERVQHQKGTLPADVKKCEASIKEAEGKIATALKALEKPMQELQAIYDRVIEGHAEVASMTITGKIVIALPVPPDTLLTAEGMKKEASERQKATRTTLQEYITKKQKKNGHSFDNQEWRDAVATAERTLPEIMTSLEGKQNEHADDLQILSATSKKLASTVAPSAKLLSLMIDEEILRRLSSLEEKHEEPVVRRFLLKKNSPDAETVDVGDDGLTDVEERAQQIDLQSIINNAIASVQQLYIRIGYTDVQALVYAQNDIKFLQHLDDRSRTLILNDFAVNPNREEAIQAMQTYLQGLSLVVDSHEEAIGIAQCAESVRALIAERQVEVDEVIDKVQPTPGPECTLPYSRAEWTGNYPQFIKESRKEAGRLLRLISENAEQLLARILVAMIMIKDSIQKLEDVKKQTGAVVVVDISKSVKATGKDATDDLLKITSHTVVLHLSALWNAKFFAHHEIDSEGNSVLEHIRESRSLSIFTEDQRRYLISKLDEGNISQSDAQELYREYERQCIEYITKMIHYFGLEDQEERVIIALKKRIEGEAAEEHLGITRIETKKRGIANGFYQYVQGEEVDILNQCIFSLVACRLLEEIEE